VLKNLSKTKDKPEIAVATVLGKAYYLIVNELEKRNIPFLSLVPSEPIPIGIKVILTTETEKQLVGNGKTLVYNGSDNPESLINEALQIISGKERYEKVVIGVDPGDTMGLAVLTDGKVIETSTCLGVYETQRKIGKIIKNFSDIPIESITVKIGDGVPLCEESLLRLLDKTLPSIVTLESVREAGTNRNLKETKNRRGLRDIVSAIIIAGRNGCTFQRSSRHEPKN
jgi:hypothetical protein